MKRPIMRGKEKGKGTNNEIAMLIPSEIPIHNSCCKRNCLLLLNIYRHPLYFLVIYYIHYCNLKCYKYRKYILYFNPSLCILPAFFVVMYMGYHNLQKNSFGD